MKTFLYVEDYLEYMAGYDPVGSGFWNGIPSDKKIKLARIDVNVVESIANNTTFGYALTDRQAELVCKLILKYRKQFTKEGIDVSPVTQPVYRLPIRIIDRSKRIELNDGIITVNFPYDRSLVEMFQEYRHKSIGRAFFNYDNKTWYLGLTENNVNWVVTLGKIKGFQIDESLNKMYDQIIECETQDYTIELIETDCGYTVSNAAPSLLEYVENQLGGWDKNNINTLVDYSGILGYKVNNDLKSLVPTSIQKFGTNYSSRLNPILENLVEVLDYAKITNRFPVVVYHPGSSINPTVKSIISNIFQEEEIVHIDLSGKISNRHTDFNNAKVIYIERFPKEVILNKIPLLVSYHELLHGSNKQNWINSAERIIYLCLSTLRNNQGQDVNSEINNQR